MRPAFYFLPMLHKKISDVPAFTAGDETRLQELIHPKNEPIDLPYSLAKATLEPGGASLPHTLAKSAELYIFEQGSGLVICGGQEVAVEKGSIFLVPAGQEQSVRNTGQDTLVFYCVVSPPWSAEQETVNS